MGFDLSIRVKRRLGLYRANVPAGNTDIDVIPKLHEGPKVLAVL